MSNPTKNLSCNKAVRKKWRFMGLRPKSTICDRGSNVWTSELSGWRWQSESQGWTKISQYSTIPNDVPASGQLPGFIQMLASFEEGNKEEKGIDKEENNIGLKSKDKEGQGLFIGTKDICLIS